MTHHQQQAYNDEGAASRITSRILANDEKRRDLSERKKRTSFHFQVYVRITINMPDGVVSDECAVQ